MSNTKTFLQFAVTEEERVEIEVYLAKRGIRNKTAWLKDLTLHEVRENSRPAVDYSIEIPEEEVEDIYDDEPIQRDGDVPTSKASDELDLF